MTQPIYLSKVLASDAFFDRNLSSINLPSITRKHIQYFASNCKGFNIDEFRICSDGSAIPLQDSQSNGNLAFLVSAGVAVVPLCNGEVIRQIEPLFVKISNAEMIADTPFDAEILGGFAALIVLKEILVMTSLESMQSKINVCLLSDSRSLIQMMKQCLLQSENILEIRHELKSTSAMPQKSELESELERNSSSESEFMKKISLPVYREVLRSQMTNLFRSINHHGQPVSCAWISGHPERRQEKPSHFSDSEDGNGWSVNDRLIWTADILARLPTDINQQSLRNCIAEWLDAIPRDKPVPVDDFHQVASLSCTELLRSAVILNSND